jgi:hypothetical protein
MIVYWRAPKNHSVERRTVRGVATMTVSTGTGVVDLVGDSANAVVVAHASTRHMPAVRTQCFSDLLMTRASVLVVLLLAG